MEEPLSTPISEEAVAAPSATPEPAAPAVREMTLVEHLAELRNRIIYVLGCWCVCATAAWYLAPWVLTKLHRLVGNAQLIFLTPTEGFFIYLKIALVGGAFLALPFALLQVALFVMPGLEPHEKRWVKRIVPGAFLLFVAGSMFAYYVLLPAALHFFLSFQSSFEAEGIKQTIHVSEYVGFVLLMVVICGAIFELPIVILILAVAGLVGSELLRSGRRWAIVIMFIVAAVAAPTPDPFTQTMVAIPMIILYEVSIWLVKAIGK